jgi:hypothetical protein
MQTHLGFFSILFSDDLNVMAAEPDDNGKLAAQTSIRMKWRICTASLQERSRNDGKLAEMTGRSALGHLAGPSPC